MNGYFLVLGTLLISSITFAQTGVVERSKNGRSVVNFRGENVAPGTCVSVDSGAAGKTAAKGGLQKRDHSLNWRIQNISAKTEVNGNSMDNNSLKLEASYLWNRGFWEIGGGFAMNQTKAASESNTMEFNLLGRWNFTENKPGNDLIPYVGGMFGLINGKTGNADVSGNGMSVEGGVSWLPFSQIFAIDASIGYVMSEPTYKTAGGSSTQKTKGLVIGAGWRIMF